MHKINNYIKKHKKAYYLFDLIIEKYFGSKFFNKFIFKIYKTL